jgi:hypothetical protein
MAFIQDRLPTVFGFLRIIFGEMISSFKKLFLFFVKAFLVIVFKWKTNKRNFVWIVVKDPAGELNSAAKLMRKYNPKSLKNQSINETGKN